MDVETRNQIVSIIDDVDDLTIATLREDGHPQATTVSYVNDGLTIYIGTDAQSQKIQNIDRDGRVSLTINRAYRTWDEIEGVSMAALATCVTDPAESAKIGELMIAKFPQVVELMPEGAEGLALIRVAPTIISLLDYKKGFGHTELVEV
jgi:general stress protein 26